MLGWYIICMFISRDFYNEVKNAVSFVLHCTDGEHGELRLEAASCTYSYLALDHTALS